MNNKKYSLKKILPAFLMLLPLAACTQAPKEVNGQPLHEVPFEQPLVLIPETGQDFYFYFKEKGKELQTDYLIGVTFLIPEDDYALRLENRKWSVVNDDTDKPGKDNLHFDVKLEYHNKQGKVIPVPLKNNLCGYSDNPAGSEWCRLWNNAYAISGTDKIIDGKVMIPFKNGLARFMPADVPVQPDGYYKLSIRPASGIRYPNIHFETFVEYEFHK